MRHLIVILTLFSTATHAGCFEAKAEIFQGITNENGNRVFSYTYHMNDKAMSTELATTSNTTDLELNYQEAN